MLTTGRKEMSASINGQQVSLFIDSVRVLDRQLPNPMEGDQTGLYVWGNKKVGFENLIIRSSRPRSFVVMQFGEPYDTLWEEVIAPVAGQADFEAIRALDISRPGVILQDIVQQIITCDVVIAEITPSKPDSNANVFYEVGYAHALGKPTILLANREKMERPPFDISGYRIVFYDDSIRGRSKVEADLREHLIAIRHGDGSSC
jgi:hypothetical protein